MAECFYTECHYAECRYGECRKLSIYTECHYAACRQAECRYAECHGAYAECCSYDYFLRVIILIVTASP